MSSVIAVRNAINFSRESGKTRRVILDHDYSSVVFTNFNMLESCVTDTAVFGSPERSGVIDLGQPFGYRFIVIKMTDKKGKVDYRIKTGCRYFTREDARQHPNWQINTARYRKRVRECGDDCKRDGIEQLLDLIDQLAKIHWGYKIPKK